MGIGIKDDKKGIRDNIEGPYYRAVGPIELEKTLDMLIEHGQRDAHFAKKIHTILYEFGQQKSLIQVDLQTGNIGYNDLLGRPAPPIIKELFAKFSLNLDDVHSWNLADKIDASLAGTSNFHDHKNIQEAHEQLEAMKVWKEKKNRTQLAKYSFFSVKENTDRERETIIPEPVKNNKKPG